MLIEQRFDLPLPPDQAWAGFCDIALLVDCLPGAALTGPALGAGVWPCTISWHDRDQEQNTGVRVARRRRHALASRQQATGNRTRA